MDDRTPVASGSSATTRPRRRRRRLLWALVGLLVVVLATVGVVWYKAQHALDQATDGKGGSVLQVLNPTALTGESTGAVNVLLAGNSFDDAGHDGADLTDSIMVAHINLSTKKVTLVSIPRDLEVEYKNNWMKINAVYVAAGDGLNGLDALGTVVEQVTGLHIDEHVLVGYTALKELVDDVGGIDVTITSSDPRGIHDARESLTITNGTHHINGTVALALCRARNDTPASGSTSQNYGLPNGDLDRQANQRKVLEALISKISSVTTLANPVTLVNMIGTVGKHVTTDLSVSQMARLRQLAGESKGTVSISIAGSNNSLLVDHTSSSLGSTLAPAAGLGSYTAITDYVTKSLG